MAKASFYSRLGVTPENSDVTPVEPNSSNAIQDSVNAASISEANAEASKNAAAQHAADANTAKQAAQSTQAAADAAKTNAQSSASAASASSVSAQNSANVASTQASDAAASAADALSQAQISQASAASAATEATNAATSATASETSRVASEAAKVASETAKAAAETAEANSATSAANAAISESNAASSASDAAASAASAAASLASIGNSEVAAAASETAAASSQAAAATSEANASASEAAAAASEAASATSASDSATSAAASAASEAAAATSASDSAASATASAASEAASAASATAAATSETNSATSAAASAASQVAAATSEANSAASEAAAATSATDAATSAADAAASATSASTAKTAAEAARDSALSALDSFDDRYLGVKSADPSLDNDGNPLATGSLYFNDQTNSMLVFDGTSWLSAYASLSGALIQTSNLSDLTDPAAARTNLGLGTAATTASTDYATAAQGTNADTAFSWGDHSAAGYATGAQGTNADTAFSWGDHSAVGYATGAQGTKADTAFGWGDHGSVGYAAGIHTHTLSDITDAGTAAASAATDFATAAQGATADAALARSGGTMTGDIAFAASQLFDGRDVSVDGAKLDGIEAGATADQTKADIDALGINADQVDGLEASQFLRSDANSTLNAQIIGSDTYPLVQVSAGKAYFGSTSRSVINLAVSSSTGVKANVGGTEYTVWHAGNDGSGSGLDADLLDGIQASSFMRSDQNTSSSGNITAGNTTIGKHPSYTSYASWYVSGESDYRILAAAGTDTFINSLGSGTIYFRNNNVNKATIDSSGNFTATGNVTAYSDARLKDNIQTIEGGLDKVCAMRGVTFEKDGKASLGVIAQEVQAVIPEVVIQNEEYLSVAYGNIVGVLIEAIKELKSEVEELKNGCKN